jgi:hypothetical protein
MTKDPGFVLYPLARPTGSAPISALFDDAAEVFARAAAAFEQGESRTASALFFSAAQTFRKITAGRAEEAAASRTVSYWNAILAAATADDTGMAQSIATSVTRDDQVCAPPVNDLLDQLGLTG